MSPLISVIIPVYKVEAYLTACVESVLAQTWQDLEIILVDDGSPDSCPRMCDELAARDSRIRVIHKENGGLSSARNAGIDAAKGRYLAFLDSDDLWSPLFLERLHRAVTQTEADFAVCLFQRFRETPPAQLPTPAETGSLTRQEAFGCLFSGRNEAMVVAWNKLYRRELFRDIRYPVGRVHEDEAIIHALIGASGRVAWVDETHHFYRETPGSITNSGFSPRRLDAVWAKEQRTAWFEDRSMTDLADRTRIATLALIMYLYRAAIASAAEPDIFRQLHSRFHQLYTKPLLRRCSSKQRLRFFLFRHTPRLISAIDNMRLNYRRNI